MNQPLHDEYINRREVFSKEVDRLKKRLNVFTALRLLIFSLGGVGIYFLFGINPLGAGIASLVLVIIFLYLVRKYADLKEHYDLQEQLMLVNGYEVAAIYGNLEFFGNGKSFINQNHAYSYDLDLFGEHSIFHHINRNCSPQGEQQLADWLTTPTLDSNEISGRQNAVRELTPLVDWRQTFQSIGNLYEETATDFDEINDWLTDPVYFDKAKSLKVIRYLGPAVTCSILAVCAIGLLPWNFFLLAFIGQLLYVGLYAKKIGEYHSKLSRKFQVLKKYAGLLQSIEQQDFSAELLTDLKDQLKEGNDKASEQLRQLAKISDALDNRFNALAFLIMNGLFMWDLHNVIRLEKWKLSHKAPIERWFSVIGKVDALSSLAAFAYNHVSFTYPEIKTDNTLLKAKALGHPLLADEERINNDVEMQGKGKLMLITGANMAGKSTFLRAMGVNQILGMTGSVVCAEHMEFSPTEMYTSMRLTDSIQRNESFFYAELKRLKHIIDELANDRPIFVLLDEILKGTNSKDQHTGAAALIEQLIRLGGRGLIATHDLSLGTLQDQYPEHVENKCFEIEIVDDELVFDYLLKDGISRNLNATFLMKKMGITV